MPIINNRNEFNLYICEDLSIPSIMSNSDNTTLDPIKFKSLTKEKLAQLLSVVNNSETTNVRHLGEKKLFVQALCSGQWHSNEMDRMPELIGTLLYISSGKQCQYGYSYFKNKLLHFKKIIDVWDVFLGNVAKCISELPNLTFDNIIDIRINGFIHLKIQRENILLANIDMANLDNLYTIKGDSFYYETLLAKGNDLSDARGQLIHSEFEANGSKLKETFKNLNTLHEYKTISRITSYALYHNELI